METDEDMMKRFLAEAKRNCLSIANNGNDSSSGELIDTKSNYRRLIIEMKPVNVRIELTTSC